MKIILSGGWGFGNLGDDAILLASIKLLKQKYPLSNIVVITNNVKETEQILLNESDVTIEESVFKKIFGDIRVNIPMDISQKMKWHVKRKAKKYVAKLNSVIKKDLLSFEMHKIKNVDAIKSFRHLCDSASVYVMSGGGYLNEWTEMAIAKSIESTIANKQGLKCYLIGQTIGPFKTKGNFDIVNNICSLMQGIFYRDMESIDDTKKMGIECLEEPVPDLALYEEFFFKKDNQIVVVPFRKDMVDNLDNFCVNIKRIAERGNFKIIIAVTQLWYEQVKIALFIYCSLICRNIEVEIFIPRNVFELQRILGESRLVISQNLHGLIMAYRSYTPIISLNAGRKFVTFMDMIKASNFIIEPKHFVGYKLYDLSVEALGGCEESEAGLFVGQIKQAIDKTLS